jgi:hypothetical protein
LVKFGKIDLLFLFYLLAGICLYGPHAANLVEFIQAPKLEYCIWQKLTGGFLGFSFLMVCFIVVGLRIDRGSDLHWRIAKTAFLLMSLVLVAVYLIDAAGFLEYKFVYRKYC